MFGKSNVLGDGALLSSLLVGAAGTGAGKGIGSDIGGQLVGRFTLDKKHKSVHRSNPQHR